MKLYIGALAFEVTRRCNLVCQGYCMRGKRQNLDISKENVDKLLDSINQKNINIDTVYFSGGEPSLNEEMVTYIIEKIIKDNIPVDNIRFVTNGQIIAYSVIEALEKYEIHTKKKQLILQQNSGTVAISRDFYHKPLTEYHLNQYREACKYIGFYDTFKENKKNIIKTGLATNGIPYKYKLTPINIKKMKDRILVDNGFYLTASGYLTTNGDGCYDDMDKINLGHINDIDLAKIINDMINIPVEEKNLVKKIGSIFENLKNPR